MNWRTANRRARRRKWEGPWTVAVQIMVARTSAQIADIIDRDVIIRLRARRDGE